MTASSLCSWGQLVSGTDDWPEVTQTLMEAELQLSSTRSWAMPGCPPLRLKLLLLLRIKSKDPKLIAGGVWGASRGKLLLLSSQIPGFICLSFLLFLAPSPLQPDLVQYFPWGECWSRSPDGGHRTGSPYLSPSPWDREFICDVRPGHDLEKFRNLSPEDIRNK